MPQNHWPEPELEQLGAVKCVCCCRRRGLAGMSNRWWDSRCGCGSSARRCGCARRRTRSSRSCWPSVGVPLMPVGPSVRELVHRDGAADAGGPAAARGRAGRRAVRRGRRGGRGMRRAGGDRPVPAVAGARSVAEKLGIRYVYVTFHRSPCRRRTTRRSALPGRPFPPEVTDNRALWELDAESIERAVRRGRSTPTGRRSDCHRWTTSATTSSPTGRGWRRTRSWLRGRSRPDLDVVQTGAWILPDERPLPADLEAFLDAGAPPVYVGFGSMPCARREDVARVAIEAIRAQGRRVVVARGWADLALIDDRDDCFAVGEVNHQALFRRVAAVVHHGGAGTTTTAARAGAPQVVVPQIGGPAVLGRPGGRAGHRRGARRPDADLRVPVGRARDGAGPRDPRTSEPPWPARSAPTARRWPPTRLGDEITNRRARIEWPGTRRSSPRRFGARRRGRCRGLRHRAPVVSSERHEETARATVIPPSATRRMTLRLSDGIGFAAKVARGDHPLDEIGDRRTRHAHPRP